MTRTLLPLILLACGRTIIEPEEPVPPPDRGPCRFTVAGFSAHTTQEDLTRRLQGTWELCDGAIWSGKDAIGLRFQGTNAVHLVWSPRGKLEPGVGLDYERKYDTWGQYTVGFSLTNALGNGNSYVAVLPENGAWLVLEEGGSGKRGWYERVR